MTSAVDRTNIRAAWQIGFVDPLLTTVKASIATLKRAAGYVGVLLLGAVLGGVLVRSALPLGPDLPRGERRVLDSITNQTVVEYTSTDHGLTLLTRARFIEYGRNQRIRARPELLGEFLRLKYRFHTVTDKQFITELIALDNVWETIILSRWEDIPGFERGMLDRDLGPVPDPFTVSPEAKAHIVYTYSRLGGIVKRYRFVRRGQHLRCEGHGVIMGQVGDYTRLL